MPSLKLSVAALVIALMGAASAWADCTNPTGKESETIYNGDYHTWQYCNGTSWAAMGSVFSVPWATNGTSVYYSDGKVGIGTTAPTSALTVSSSSLTADVTAKVSTGGPSSAYSPILALNRPGATEWTLRQASGQYDLAIAQDGSTKLTIQTGTGNVGIGTTSPASKLQVNGTVTLPSGDANAIVGNNASSWLVIGSDAGSNGRGDGTGSHIVLRGSAQTQNIEFYQNAGQRFIFYPTGNATFTGSLTQNSDARLKTDIHVIPSALDKLAMVRGVTFHWKDKDRDRREQMGLIAQDVEKAFPQLVSADASGTLNVNYQGMVGPLVEAVKELKADNDNLRAEFEAYKGTHP